ncbi:hypothetical protein CK203_063108 [Vitis vinifera]|uniref:Uncharacterized protein n=1 Tax=Vitis vinifera TaxID=29760 RepID=A0A438G5L7_VITVI|nr:hypothetical protein CK203_063108 [Vitis vinifera]
MTPDMGRLGPGVPTAIFINTVLDVSRKDSRLLGKDQMSQFLHSFPDGAGKLPRSLIDLQREIKYRWSYGVYNPGSPGTWSGYRSQILGSLVLALYDVEMAYREDYGQILHLGIERPPVSYTAIRQPCYAAQFTARPTTPYPPTQSSANFWPPPQPIPPQFRMDLHYAYHQGPGHETDRCTALRHARSGFDRPGFGALGSVECDRKPVTCPHHACSPSTSRWPQMPAPFHLVPEGGVSVQVPRVDDSQTLDVQYILQGGRVMRQTPPTATRPVEARISIWSLLASSSTHRDALIRALIQIRVETTTSPEGLVHMMMAGRATCIVFSDDNLPPEGWVTRVHFIYLSVVRPPSPIRPSGQWLDPERMSSCPAIALGYAPSDFGPSTQTIRAYDSTRREVMGTLEIKLLISPATFVAVFQVLRILTSCVVVQSVGDVFILAEPVLEISHADDDIFLTGFTFDEV